MKKKILPVSIAVLVFAIMLLVSGVRSAQAQEEKGGLWVRFYTYEVPLGTWTEGAHTWVFTWTYTVPNPGSGQSALRKFNVSASAPVYPGFAVFRHNRVQALVPGLDGLRCEDITIIHPSQPTRFLVGYRTEKEGIGLMTYPQARAFYESLIFTVHWDGLPRAQMTPHQIERWNENKVDKLQDCYPWAVRQTP